MLSMYLFSHSARHHAPPGGNGSGACGFTPSVAVISTIGHLGVLPPVLLRTPMRLALPLVLLALSGAVFAPLPAQRFSFPQDEEKAKREQQQERDASEARVAADLSVACRADLKNKKIMVIIGERQSNGYIEAHQ